MVYTILEVLYRSSNYTNVILQYYSTTVFLQYIQRYSSSCLPVAPAVEAVASFASYLVDIMMKTMISSWREMLRGIPSSSTKFKEKKRTY